MRKLVPVLGFLALLAACGDSDTPGAPDARLSPDAAVDAAGQPDAQDLCPADPSKTVPGICGCGVPDTDTDNDGTADCNDGCPADAAKTSPGACGCGAAETDGDSDGTPNCLDGCPADPGKIAPGQCGCGNPDTNSDGDARADCVDGCPFDGAKTAAGQCGCNVPDTDNDSDGTANCLDGCPDDPTKTDAGICGCGVADTDADSDGIAGCLDPCPDDPENDLDGDTYCESDDCQANDPNAHPDATERCNGRDDDCNTVVDDGACATGCADGAREGFTDASFTGIAGCSGGWTMPGIILPDDPTCDRAAGDDGPNPTGTGCTVNDLCAVGWHVCLGATEVAARAGNCNWATAPGDPNLFFATRQRSPGSFACGTTGENDVFGCGNYGYTSITGCAPLDHATGNLCGGLAAPWSCGSDGLAEATNITKPGASLGGVLCCRDQCTPGTVDGDADGIYDGCDPCPADPANDADGDGRCAADDDCPTVFDPAQADFDGDSTGDACDDDDDDDGADDVDDCAPLNAAIHPAAAEACNDRDDDCDDDVDEAGCSSSCTREEYNGHVYLACDEAMDWPAAQATCEALGYDLATVGDAAEDAALWGFVSGDLGGETTWMGLTDQAAEGAWVWASTIPPTSYTHWESTAPNTAPGNVEDCVTWRTGYGGQWNDLSCSMPSLYLCESYCGETADSDGDGYTDDCDCADYDPLIHAGAVEVCNGKDDDCDSSIDESGVCGAGCSSIFRGDHWYVACNASTATWAAARSACLAHGLDLATVETAAENTWLATAATWSSAYIYTGYNDLATEGVWVWADGSRAQYTNWNTGEPNNSGGLEDCGHIYGTGMWNDINCAGAYNYVCEGDPCPGDSSNDIDGDGVCGSDDNCPTIYNPEQDDIC